MKVRKTVILTGYTCNNKCIFCCNEDRRNRVRDKSTREIQLDLTRAKERGTSYVEFVGGEPTIRTDIARIISFARGLGFRTIMFATNGRMLSNKAFAKKILESGINEIVFSLHGHNAVLHDKLTRVPGSFDQLMRGMRNLRQQGFRNVGTNTTIVRQNYKSLPKIGRLIHHLGVRDAEFIFVDPSHGAPKRNFFELVPTYEQVSPYVNQLLKFGKARRILHWHIRYYPFCFVDERYHDMVSENIEAESFHTEHLAPDFVDLNVTENRKTVGRMKIGKCMRCSYGDQCEGYWRDYVERRGPVIYLGNSGVRIMKNLKPDDSKPGVTLRFS
jgi:MoaA/NifB/PqqE/SkfB family radical SAM enzyme